ncbi:putative metal-dependent phosphoesterase TrpH [Aurantimicrobium minutum]|uniref:PHP domain-containing protein n=1 Tax=Aurantimicrobium minutum TaxID=708131 RepID=UPI0024733AEE|nr:PHP domain-containing protein [Aurantimicrobium minutum]MDH6410238.1 putative metal-dependent phosphoesterase TrpH [Aurantimicrobium minutum]
MEAFLRAQGPIDLHLHSNVSDGTGSPTDVVREAHAAGVRTMALTDHDTAAGWDEAREECMRLGMTFIPGMEFSSRIEHGSIHILAYLIDPNFAPLAEELDKLQNDRENRLRQMTENVGADYDITWDHVMEQVAASGKSLGRPHLADALVAQGIIGERSEAFDGILSKNGPYYVSQYALDPVSAVKLIRAAGGVPVMAHPTTRGRVAPMEYIDRLIDAGLGGYEIEHRENMEPGKTILREICLERGLIMTGSSDYHGTGKPNQPGENTTAPEMLAKIIEQGTGASPSYPA